MLIGYIVVSTVLIAKTVVLSVLTSFEKMIVSEGLQKAYKYIMDLKGPYLYDLHMEVLSKVLL
jgi:hypothetical protein